VPVGAKGSEFSRSLVRLTFVHEFWPALVRFHAVTVWLRPRHFLISRFEGNDFQVRHLACMEKGMRTAYERFDA
jgi:hypothetical protein